MLFDRDSRPLRLTEAGRLFFEHATQVLERFDDLRHLNRAGAAGWQAYDRAAIHVVNEPHRLSSVTYSMRRPVP